MLAGVTGLGGAWPDGERFEFVAGVPREEMNGKLGEFSRNIPIKLTVAFIVNFTFLS